MNDDDEATDPHRTGLKNVPARIARVLVLARRALIWERLWPALVQLASAVGLFLAASWADLWSWLPAIARPFALIFFLALAAFAAVPLLRLRLPGRAAILRRLDDLSGHPHRPATALDDRLGTRPDDPVSRALWDAHQSRMLAATRDLEVGLPQPRLVERDRYALRALALLLVVVTWFAAEGEHTKRILTAFDWTGIVATEPYRVDAWVTPPAYTGRPPLLLAGVRSGEPLEGRAATGAVEVPVGSIITVRATGLSRLDLRVGGGLVDAPPAASSPAAAPPSGTLERKLTIAASGQLSLHGVGDTDLVWAFQAVPDRPPTIALARPPSVVGRGAVSLTYRVEDDYGVTSAEARVALQGQPEAARPLYEPPLLPLALPQARTRSGTGETVRDLTEHPFAGAAVALTLAARDDAGNEGTSEPVETVLPQRSFTDPLARALIEQRRWLATDAGSRPRVERALDAFSLAPQKFSAEAAIFLGLRSAYWRLANARDDDDLRDVVDYLWQFAVQLEDGDMAEPERALRNAENALRQALENGASDEELKRLAENLRQALDRFLRDLAQQLQRNNQRAEQRPLDRNARMLRQQDLKNMIDRLENLARSGARDAARRLLDELQAMLDNLDRRRSGQMAEGDQNSNELGDMIRNQQQLRDRTWREGRDQQRRERSRQGQRGELGQQYGDLQQNQEQLRQRLEQMLEQLRRQRRERGEPEDGEGLESNALGSAREAMRDAEGKLGDGDADGAVDSQGRALENLRRGAQAMAQDQQGDGQGNPRGPGQTGENDTDPLGRPRAANRTLDSNTRDAVPDAIDAQRARRVLEELRRRFGDAARPRLELDYLERLLRDF